MRNNDLVLRQWTLAFGLGSSVFDISWSFRFNCELSNIELEN
jgi:hypothetical protein